MVGILVSADWDDFGSDGPFFFYEREGQVVLHFLNGIIIPYQSERDDVIQQSLGEFRLTLGNPLYVLLDPLNTCGPGLLQGRATLLPSG